MRALQRHSFLGAYIRHDQNFTKQVINSFQACYNKIHLPNLRDDIPLKIIIS